MTFAGHGSDDPPDCVMGNIALTPLDNNSLSIAVDLSPGDTNFHRIVFLSLTHDDTSPPLVIGGHIAPSVGDIHRVINKF